jgi:hypothetical protein
VVYVDYSTCFVQCFISLNIVDKLKIKTTLVNESRSKLTTSKPKCAQQWVGDCCLTPNEQCFVERRVWRYQRGNQNPYIEEEHTIQWTKDKVRKDKQRSTKHTYKTKDRVTRTPSKTGDELRCSGRVSSSCSTSGTRGVNLVTNPVISREWGKDREVLTTCRSVFVLLVLFLWPLWWLSFFDLRITPFDIFKLLLHLCHNGKELYLNEIMMVSAFYISNTIKM